MPWSHGGENTISAAIITNNPDELLACHQLMIQKGTYQNIHAYTNPYTMLSELPDMDCSLVLVDMELRNMRALEFSSRLLKVKPNVKMVFLSQTGNGALEALQMGASDFLMKPLTLEKLTCMETKIGLKVD